MKTLVSSTLAALIIATPAVSFAQQHDRPLTRAEVKAEMARLAAVGYTPALDHNQYPVAILAAEKRVRENAVAQAASNTAPAADTTGYGSEGTSTSASGHALTTNGRAAIYRGH
ncbi:MULTISPECIES: DUF4148 domain-containing protein [unclassified Burkholderia]|uniref:DUF4148 domain-containing protein n=1 Tax=unclassified Burkholderia TaxID=2613784 RepID=UPI000F566E85|nr:MULTISPECIES: DUF4148 domain-containing protein [unclassified Burkholderia]RQR35852.1 DUF4148 domain-containing protein [Burkholderia sp. Bp9131]RQR69008.1 DUF4148 domain-containing protein [Burkholderia sp. Bp9015]RQS04277.1 DUF4148 domain-containing protein [Burkholderia sp. Bp8991]RQS29791.1 DUF4148 domain-containing protein [Burkholderia sp. Bp8995]RQS47887.1 DUF4148 domain-containing protein [Burkholderia sp. Bp8989]